MTFLLNVTLEIIRKLTTTKNLTQTYNDFILWLELRVLGVYRVFV